MPTRFPIAIAAALLVSSAARADTWYVNATLASGADDGRAWSSAFRGRLGLQHALAVAQPGDSIWVAAGTYAPAAPNGPRAATFQLIPGVQLLGGFQGDEPSPDLRDPAAHPTILTGDLNSNGNQNFPLDNSFHVVSITDADPSTLLDGFIIRDGVADNGETDFAGGCILVTRGAPAIRHCTISDGSAFRGGGVAVMSASPSFEDCTFTRSVASFGSNFLQTFSSNSTLRRCNFVGQSLITGGSSGVGIFSGRITSSPDDSTLTVDDCFFSIVEREFSCPAGIAICAIGGHAIITNSRFIDNKGCGDGAIHADADVSIDRCTFIGNEGRFDGGAALFSFEGTWTVTNSLFLGNDREGFSTFSIAGTSTFTNCTIVANGNTANFHSVFHLFDGPHTIRNSVIWNNATGSGPSPVFQGNANAVNLRFDRSLVQGWTGQWPGEHSFAADPRFANPLGPDHVAGTIDDDLRPAATSPVIDRGDNTFLASALTLDLAARPRFRDDPATPDSGVGTPPIIDLGAFEFQPACVADFNQDAVVDSRDFFDFLTAFFAGAPAADFNHDAIVNSADFFDFLSAFFTPCPR